MDFLELITISARNGNYEVKMTGESGAVKVVDSSMYEAVALAMMVFENRSLKADGFKGREIDGRVQEVC
jgi:hypothetical protein